MACFGEYHFGSRASEAALRLEGISEDRVAALNREAGEARQKAGEAEGRAANLEASMMLRRLSKKQGAALCASIPRNLVNQVVVTSSSQDWEAFRYAADFNEAIKRCSVSAGLEPSGGVGNSFWSQSVTFGVWVRFPKHFTLDNPSSSEIIFNPARREALAKSVRKALEASGVRIEGLSNEGRGLIDIYVGPKLPPQTEYVRKVPAKTSVMPAQEMIGDRHLTVVQQSRVTKLLCGFGGIYVDIGLYNSDGEIQALGQDIKGALPELLPSPCEGKPGFAVSIVQKLATIGFSGIQIIVKEGTSEKSKSFADALAATLRQEGLRVDGPMPEPKRGTVTSGGSAFKRSIGAGIEQGTPVEIAIGKNP